MVTSVYIHIPFCRHKCPYCHFYVIGDKESFKEDLLAALKLEFATIRPQIEGKKLTSIYFGGGTPTLFGPKRIQEVLSWFSFDNMCEITIETNPEELADYKTYRDIGINRISLGVQSLSTAELMVLDRRHKPEQALDAVYAMKKAGLDNITIDLMYDLPGQTLASWENTLNIACTLPITHLSLYNLTIEPDACFFRREKEIRKMMPDEDTSTAMYAMAQEKLSKAGFTQYEISAFCKDNLYSRHNIGYWTGRIFYGMGPSAFSFDGKRRYRNVANLARYKKLLEEGASPIDFEEVIDENARKRELLTLNLRLLEGIDLTQFAPLEKETEESILKLIEQGLLLKNENHLALSPKGILFYDTIASELI